MLYANCSKQYLWEREFKFVMWLLEVISTIAAIPGFNQAMESTHFPSPQKKGWMQIQSVKIVHKRN